MLISYGHPFQTVVLWTVCVAFTILVLLFFFFKYSTQKKTVPKPCFMQKTIQDVGIGTFRNIATVQQTASVYDALSVFVERRVSALPVVNEQGGLT